MVQSKNAKKEICLCIFMFPIRFTLILSNFPQKRKRPSHLERPAFAETTAD